MCGFGTAVLEAISAAGLSAEHVHRLGIPDEFIEHGDRGELLADLALDAEGIAATCRQIAAKLESVTGRRPRQAS
ncbi:MAG: 1-deoxy-D-xylulose-5-phosphate synthase, partial [Planctomycetota bacterium]|nr:1-deoxy-D-xylulose-5-phosphate synthase [Planctomycetota bacterium]